MVLIKGVNTKLLTLSNKRNKKVIFQQYFTYLIADWQTSSSRLYLYNLIVQYGAPSVAISPNQEPPRSCVAQFKAPPAALSPNVEHPQQVCQWQSGLLPASMSPKVFIQGSSSKLGGSEIQTLYFKFFWDYNHH